MCPPKFPVAQEVLIPCHLHSLIKVRQISWYVFQCNGGARARFDSSSKEKCLPHTRVSILNSIQSRLAQGRSSFIWLRGSPGTGKSTIAKTITASLEEEKRLASTIYFDKTFGHDNAFSALHFVSSIAYQIAKFNSFFCEALGQILSEDGGIRKHADSAGHIEQLLKKPLSHLPPPVTTTSWVVIIEALDECGSRAELKQLMDMLAKFAELPLTFLVTSRPEPEVVDRMDGPELSLRVTVEDLNMVDQCKDVVRGCLRLFVPGPRGFLYCFYSCT